MLGHAQIKEDIVRLVDSGRLAQGYLFFGSMGVGKSCFARGLAEYLERGEWGQGRRPLSDAFFVSASEGGTIGIDAARLARSFLSERPNAGKRRIVVVEDAEAMTTEAQNALLKITEEPPADSLLLLTAKGKDSLLPTLVSRLQPIYFGRVPDAEILDWLVQQGISKKAAASAVKAADGKPGLALGLSKGETPDSWRMAKDFLEAPTASRKEFLKTLLEPEDFSFKGFLDGLIMVLAGNPKRNRDLWHAVLELRQMVDSTGLNPSIQLRNLWTLI